MKIGDRVQIGIKKENTGVILSIAPTRGKAVRVKRDAKFLKDQYETTGAFLPEVIGVERKKITIL